MSYGSLGQKGEMDSDSQWKEEFSAIMGSLDNTIAEIKRVTDNDQRKELLQQAESDEYTAKNLLDRIQGDIRGMNYENKKKSIK